MSKSQRLRRSTPEEQGISSAVITEFIEALQQTGQEIHTIMLVRHGFVITEGGWKPYSPDLPRLLNSVTKSFTSAAIGFAVAEGRLSVEDTVLSFFSEEAPVDPSSYLSAMRVKHLLAMATGHTEDTIEYIRAREDGDWVRGFLEFPVKEVPGTRFIYNSGASHILSAIIQKLTGETLHDYLQIRLLEPLGIMGTKWESCPRGINTGGWGLSITTEDIAKFGQLYLNKGVWKDQQLLSEEWIAESVQSHISNGDDPNSDWAQGYGYQFWLNRCHGSYRADGAFGQLSVVMPKQDAVLAVTAAVTDLGIVLEQVWQVLIPALNVNNILFPTDDKARSMLADKLSSLTISPLRLADHSVSEGEYSGQRYVRTVGEAVVDMTHLSFQFEAGECILSWSRGLDNEKQSLRCGLGVWQENRWNKQGESERIAGSGTWQDETTFIVSVRLLESAIQDTYLCQFDGNRLVVSYNRAFVVEPVQSWKAEFERE